MKRVKSKTNEPKIRLVGWHASAGAAAAAIASLAAGGAQAAPGDLDPSFGDVGRQSNLGITSDYGQELLWSVDAADDDSVLFAGGDLSCPWYCYEYLFIGKLTPEGTPNADFTRTPLNGTVYDTALQADGKLVGVGNVPYGGTVQLFRQRVDGSLDPEFGLGGIVRVGDGTTSNWGYALALEANGRITVAGQRDSRLLVARFLSNGAPDPAFGSNGVYLGKDSAPPGLPLRIAALPTGGYRILANMGASIAPCTVVGLTESGSPDPTFGNGTGAAQVHTTAGDRVFCNSMVVLADGRSVVVGSTEDGQARATRLLANGAKDASFDADGALRPFRSATAIAPGAAGKLFVATASDDLGVHVTRLSADGALDTTYGTAGTATIDLFAARAPIPRVTDLKALSGDRLLVAGQTSGPAFVARLLGNAPAGGPGVLSMTSSRFISSEQHGEAVVTVRRTGGSKGAVAVSYATKIAPDGVVAASIGQDLTATSGRLEWADGEAGERQVVVPIATDTEEESPEFFAVTLSSPEGGAGLGTTGADVEIAGAGYPAGQIRLAAWQQSIVEGQSARFSVSRAAYAQGTVSVTLRVASESSATAGEDFASPGLAKGWQDVVLTWADGDFEDKFVAVPLVVDDRVEPAEALVLELAFPTGGAVLAPDSKVTVYTLPESQPPFGGSSGGGGGGGGGGGSFGWFGALLLGLWGTFRRR